MSYNACNILSAISTCFLFLSFYVCSVTASPSTTNFNNSINNQSRPESENLKSIRNYLKKINKPAVKTIKSLDGDLIDCVLFEQQPAFDHPLLQEYKSLRALPEIPTAGSSPNTNDTTFEEIVQVWRLSGDSCPNNTVPIRRTTEEDVLRAGSVKNYAAKSTFPLERATIFVQGNFKGVEALVSTWRPNVANENEYSSGQIWLTSGDNLDLNAIEVGYKVAFRDQKARLFIHWTTDGYVNTGCENLACPGFVQLPGTHIALGSAGTTSTYLKKMYVFKPTVWKASEDGLWWLQINGEHIGYWPPELFTGGGLRELADTVKFGGEIVNSGGPGQHTSTQMGSGHFAEGRDNRAAFIGNIAFVDNNYKQIKKLPSPVRKDDNEACYDSLFDARGYVFYGGPGRSSNATACT